MADTLLLARAGDLSQPDHPSLKPDASCQWPALAKAPGLARAAAAVSPPATTLSIPAGPVTVNITINVGVREDGASE